MSFLAPAWDAWPFTPSGAFVVLVTVDDALALLELLCAELVQLACDDPDDVEEPVPEPVVVMVTELVACACELLVTVPASEDVDEQLQDAGCDVLPVLDWEQLSAGVRVAALPPAAAMAIPERSVANAIAW